MFRCTNLARSRVVVGRKLPEGVGCSKNINPDTVIALQYVRPRKAWKPHFNLARVNDVSRLEFYLKCHIRKLGWMRSRIAKEKHTSYWRKRFRINITRQVKMIKYVEDQIHALNGTLRIPKLIPVNEPNWVFENKAQEQITVVHRIPRDYDYPSKDKYEPMVEAANERAKMAHEAYTRGYANI